MVSYVEGGYYVLADTNAFAGLYKFIHHYLLYIPVSSQMSSTYIVI